MNLTELVDVVANETGLTKGNTKSVIKSTLEVIMREVSAGGRVTIVGFGAFYSTSRRARLGRNPQTGESVAIPAIKVPRYRPGKDFKDGLRDCEPKKKKKKKK